MRLQLVVSEESGGEGAQRESEASVEMGSEDHILSFLSVGLNLPGRRYPCLHSIGDAPASAKPIDVALDDVAACPRPSVRFLRTFWSFLPFLPLFLGFFSIFFPFVLSVCGLLSEVGRGKAFRGHWCGVNGSRNAASRG